MHLCTCTCSHAYMHTCIRVHAPIQVELFADAHVYVFQRGSVVVALTNGGSFDGM